MTSPLTLSSMQILSCSLDIIYMYVVYCHGHNSSGLFDSLLPKHKIYIFSTLISTLFSSYKTEKMYICYTWYWELVTFKRMTVQWIMNCQYYLPYYCTLLQGGMIIKITKCSDATFDAATSDLAKNEGYRWVFWFRLGQGLWLGFGLGWRSAG